MVDQEPANHVHSSWPGGFSPGCPYVCPLFVSITSPTHDLLKRQGLCWRSSYPSHWPLRSSPCGQIFVWGGIEHPVRPKRSGAYFQASLDIYWPHWPQENQKTLQHNSTEGQQSRLPTRLLMHSTFWTLPQNTAVSETQEFRTPFSRESRDPSSLNTITQRIMCFKGWRGDPRWLDEQSSKWPIAGFFLGVTDRPCRAVLHCVLGRGGPEPCSETWDLFLLHSWPLLPSQIWHNTVVWFDWD